MPVKKISHTSLGDLVYVSDSDGGASKNVSVYLLNGSRQSLGGHVVPHYGDWLVRHFNILENTELVVNLRTGDVFEGFGLPVKIQTSSNAEKLKYAEAKYKKAPLVA